LKRKSLRTISDLLITKVVKTQKVQISNPFVGFPLGKIRAYLLL